VELKYGKENIIVHIDIVIADGTATCPVMYGTACKSYIADLLSKNKNLRMLTILMKKVLHSKGYNNAHEGM